MEHNLKLSPKYGTNPTTPVCFWCQKPRNEMAFMGQIDEEDSKAPDYLIVDYKPCDACKEIQEKGITIIDATNEPQIEGQAPIQHANGKPVYPTSSYMVVKEEVVKLIIQDEKEQKRIIEQTRGMIIHKDLFDLIAKTIESKKDPQGGLDETDN